MKPRLFRVVVPALSLAAWPLSAQEVPGREEVLGTVIRVQGQRLEVRTTAGATRTLELDSGTRYLRGGRAASPRDLRPRTRVAVEAEDVSGRWVARFVRIGVTAPRAPAGAAPARPTPSAPRQVPEPAPPAHAHGQPAPPAHGHEQPEPQAPAHEHPAQPVPSAPAVAAAEPAPDRNLFQSDMTLMAGMTAEDPMAATPMPRWHWMTTGTARLVYNRQGGLSGEEQAESSNWIMTMGQRDVGRGRLTLMMMNSLEAMTLPGAGSAQLFQTGETFEGFPIVDHQHPHDFFMNLSATWRLPLGDHGAAWLQAAVRGEPALGPTTFMHRASAGENPAAILSHHFQDSTHITDDVVTLGAGWRWLTLEGSLFHGEEPDEGRWDLDPGALDSWSARLKVRLGDGWSGQVSHGFLNEPEAFDPGDVERTTASLHYGERGDRPFAASFVWGRNRESHGTFDGFVLEGAYQLTDTDHFYLRAEQVDRDPELLIFKGGPRPARVVRLPEQQLQAADGNAEVRALTLGYLKDVRIFGDVKWLGPVRLGLGADLTVYQYESILDGAYGESPLSVHAFLRVRWGAPHGSGGHAAHH